MLKQVIVVRKDLSMPKGKLAAQVAHASTALALKAKKEILKKWMQQGMKKVVLKVESLEELEAYEAKANKAKLPNIMITDAGKTFLEPGTTTCLGIGPEEEKKIDGVTGKLKML